MISPVSASTRSLQGREGSRPGKQASSVAPRFHLELLLPARAEHPEWAAGGQSCCSGITSQTDIQLPTSLPAAPADQLPTRPAAHLHSLAATAAQK